jgi:L-gulonate 5-dehydrogenase
VVAIAVSSPGVLEFVERATPRPGAGEVLVRVERAGICGSDIHILHGSNPFARYPRVIGHEFAGHVVEVGTAVDAVAHGDRVVIDPVLSCGHCYACRIGRSNVCGNLEVLGVHRDGGFRDHAVIVASSCVKIPAGLPIEVATLAEPFAVAANVLSRTGIGADDTVLIYGAGTVGLTVLQVARLHGARCIVSDPDAARLDRARAYGAAVVIDPRAVSVPEAVRDENDGLGPTVVIDGAGIPSLLEGSLPGREPRRADRPARLLCPPLQHQPAGNRQEGACDRRLPPQSPFHSAGGGMAVAGPPAARRHDHADLCRPRCPRRVRSDRERAGAYHQGPARLCRMNRGQLATPS